MKDFAESVKAVVRPFVIAWGFIVYGTCIMTEIEVPVLLQALVAAVIAEYFGERALMRFKGGTDAK